MFYEVIPVGKVETLTYDFDGSLFPGQIVLVPLGKKPVPGIIVKKVAQPIFKTKSILKILYAKPLPSHLLKVAEFIHEYYLVPIGLTANLILPTGVEKKRRTKPNKTEQNKTIPSQANIPLNPAQKMALEGLQKGLEGTKLLYGVTGSGKTNIYLKMAINAFKRQKSTMLLVPEIALTSQLVQIFQEIFKNNVVLIHSKQTEAERHLIFESILEAEEPLIIIGPRSALFAPVYNLELIIVDEEHETTYYQENPPRYSAIRVASFIATAVKGQCILGSATPTVTDYYIAKQKDSLITLKERAKKEAKKADINIIDLKNRDSFSKNKYFSNQILASIKKNLEEKRQTLIFHNRRGSAPLTICEHCGHEITCPNCFLPLTLHADTYELVCHTCEHHEKVPLSCPECGHLGLIHKGFGTKLLESELKKLFPKARIKRFDADNKKGETLDAIYEEVRDGKVDILVGTQGLAKGLDLPKLATVGVVQADAGLSLPDYAAEERVFQLITQVIGRVGRGHLDAAEVIIQTFRPEHPVLKYATEENYEEFAKYLLKQRQKSGFPPYKYVVKLELTMKTEAIIIKKMREIAQKLQQNANFLVSPPQPAFHERTIKGYTWEMIIRSKSRKELLKMCSNLDQNFRLTLDPPSLL
ncbi:primosomal protein N' [Candidatus Saccharibacteria bacterium]|nr:primosomal protein N' [Candidatus Saccharibacteria bacterium]